MHSSNHSSQYPYKATPHSEYNTTHTSAFIFNNGATGRNSTAGSGSADVEIQIDKKVDLDFITQ